MRYSAYLSYKPSGIEWLGPVPEHWEVKPLKHALSEIVSGGTPDVSNDQYWAYGDEPGLNWVAIADMTRNVRVRTTDRRITDAGRASKDLHVLPPGVLLYSMYASLGKVAILEIPAAFNQAILGLYPAERKLEREYLRFWLNSMEPRLALFSSSNTQDNLNAAKVRQMPLFVPPLDEQRVIANFLDFEIVKLDTLVAKKRTLIEKLKERRTALISRTVTGGLPPDAARAAGLNPHPKLKPSGIEWLGELPEHWETRRLRHISDGITVGVVVNPSTYVTDEGVPFLLGGDIREFKIDTENCNRCLAETSDGPLRKSRLTIDDVVVVRVGYPGVAAVIPSDLDGANCASMMIVRKHPRFNSKWLAYAFNCQAGRDQIEIVQYGAAQKQFNISHAVDFTFPFPPLLEQRTIADYLDRETVKIERMLNKVEAAIKRLQEYRAALITAAVTGKIDVRGETRDNKPVLTSVS